MNVRTIQIGSSNISKAFLGDSLIYQKFLFDPLTLFAGGKQGVWYDISDKTTLFQDVAGTVPVTKSGDPVALMRDKSGNGNHANQTLSASRPTYQTDGILHWLLFDGVDDFLSSSVLDLSTSDKVSVFFARKVLSYTGASNLLSGTNINSVGSFGEYQRATYQGRPTAALTGTTFVVGQMITNSFSDNFVLTLLFDVGKQNAVDEVVMRGNGIPTSLGFGGSASAGSGSFSANSKIQIGNSSTKPNLNFYGLVVLDRTALVSEIGNVEGYLAQKSGVIL